MMQLKDPRIDTKSFTWKSFWLQFLVIMGVCGCFLAIYVVQPHTHESGVYLALSILAYLVAISFLLSLVLMFFRRYVFMRPLDALQKASRRVAQGDFYVRIPPQRKDGKKDEFEVMYEDFNAMVEKLSSIEMLKKDFISNVSHELKTPVAVIQNYASILQSNSLTEAERHEYAQRIDIASTRLSELTTNILQISRLENQKIANNCRVYNLSEQLCSCIIGFEQILDEKNIELVTDLNQSIQIYSDEGLLDVVWNNLLSNALKFTEVGGTVRISITGKEDVISVVISDTGCGIDEKAIPHIFDKFYQEDTSHATRGNGLGLAMVKRVVELLHGTISVESKPGKGSTFTVSLPR